MELTIKGKVVPAVRMTQRSKWVDPRAQAYLDSQERIAYQVLEQVDSELPAFPRRKRIWLGIEFHGKYRRCDLSNLTKAIEDAGNGILWHDDRQIDRLHIWRVDGDEYVTNIIVSEIAQ